MRRRGDEDDLLRRTAGPAALAYGLAGTWVRLQDPPVLQLPTIAFTGWITLAAAAATTEVLLAEGLEISEPGRGTWAVGVLSLAGGIAATVTRRVPAGHGYPAAVVWGLLATAVRSFPRRRPAGVAAMAAALAVTAAPRRPVR